MRVKILIVVIFFSFKFIGLSQVESLENFKANLDSVSTDSTFKLVNERLLRLSSEHANDSVIVTTLKYKLYLSDSLRSKMEKHYALLELLKYPKNVTSEEYFHYLMKEGDAQINIGGVLMTMDYHFQAVRIAENIKNDTLLFKVYRRIGVNYIKSNDYPLSLKYLNKAKDIALNMNNLQKEASCNMSIGNNYKNQKIYDSAMVYYTKSIEMSKEIGWDRGLAGNYNNIGNVKRKQGYIKESIDYFNLAIDMNIKTNNKKWLSYNYNNIGSSFELMNQNLKALEYFKKSQLMKEELNDRYGQKASLFNIADLYARINNYKKAYEYFANYDKLSKELESQSKLNLTAELEAKFQNEKKEIEINKLISEQGLRDEVIKGQHKGLIFQEKIRDKEKNLRVAFGIILLSLLSTVFVFWKNSKERKKHVAEITESKKILNIKNIEITDSINYAKRIQTAILPSPRLIKENLSSSFVMYMPKDIVAGDFYWTKKINDTILFAVADCTGHGVPGALVSVVCNNALNTVVEKNDIIEPGLILDKTTVLVQHQFSKTDELVRDGMDIALCALNYDTMTLNYSGANNPLWIVREGDLIEYKSTRQPVGNYEKLTAFKTNTIQLKKGDMLYLSTDGYADQFGGEKGKKFMKKNFKDLLEVVSKFPIGKQKEKLKEAFNEWLSDYDQVDDVCVMGIRV
jgi:serine phosphatase RsbU (regulator of sigma subunit)/tetratricopeptide (TPR) repeat protein